MKHFHINLNLPIEQRYKEVIDSYGDVKIKEIAKNFTQVYKNFLPNNPLIDSAIKVNINLHKKSIMYREEIKFWSKVFDVPFYRVMMLQLLYELNAGCTTICKNGVMIRTMDWPMKFLKDITYTASFSLNGEKIYDGVCWLGSVGIFTGKNTEFSIAINYRRITSHKSIYDYFKHMHSKYKNVIEGYWPVSYLVRNIFEKNYSKLEMYNALNTNPVISPTYFTLNYFDHEKFHPVVFQRSPLGCRRFTGKYVIQTNHDCNSSDFENIMYSRERRGLAEHLIKEEKLDLENLLHPILNEDTIYISILSRDEMIVKV